MSKLEAAPVAAEEEEEARAEEQKQKARSESAKVLGAIEHLPGVQCF